jgi:hypothetical protein
VWYHPRVEKLAIVVSPPIIINGQSLKLSARF